MPTVKKPTLDLKAIADEFKLPLKEGTVSAVRDRFYLSVGRKKVEIPVGEMIDAREIKGLVGKTVPVVVAGSVIVAIGEPRRPPWGCVMCYIAPPPEKLRRIRPELRVDLINLYAKAGVIDPGLQKELLTAFTPINIP